MTRYCALCGKAVYPRKREAWRGGPDYRHTFNNVSLELDLVFCTHQHKLEVINKFLRKSKYSCFFHLFFVDYKK